MVFVVLEHEILLDFEQDVNSAVERGFKIVNCSEGTRSDGRHVYVAFLYKKK
ncbi:MAG: hypothetical protein JSW11_09255 [Candidatus Heimdallarchaeota archaeon]|nr:MAG: hypothetical protein JSW11_09255 [Candidatus Heimdallarchaeota archaeon]